MQMNKVIAFFFFLFSQYVFSQESQVKRGLSLMGCSFEITVVAKNVESGNNYIDLAVSEIQRIEKLISSWDTASQTSEIIRQAGIKPVKVDKELFDLIERALRISSLTEGAFDISYASMDNLWKFDGSMKHLPPADLIKESHGKVGYENIILDNENHTVFLKKKGMKIGFGGIGKGYAADKTKTFLQKLGVVAGVINASGDITAWGKQPSGENWKVGIKNPKNIEKAFSWLQINNEAVVTSGNYEKYVLFNGKRYSHIIDPRTGFPSSGILSVTIICKSAELADALATSVFVMGIETGIDFINQLKGIECVIVDEELKLHYSNKLNLNFYK